MGAKLVTVFGSNAARGLPSHLATIMLLDPETGALLALLDGRYITEARTAAVSAASSRLLARKTSASLAIIGSGVQAKSHLEALSRVHTLRQVTVWSPNKAHRDQFIEWANSDGAARGTRSNQPNVKVTAVEHAGEAVVGADIIVLVTSSPTPVIEDAWVSKGAHVVCVGACRPNQQEMPPALVTRSRLYVDSKAAALLEAGDIVMNIAAKLFDESHIRGEIGELVLGRVGGRSSADDITVFKSLGMAVEDVVAADLVFRRASETGSGTELTL